jgi:DNA-binding XRE family transcriptional regulator
MTQQAAENLHVKPRILFEPHRFFHQLTQRQIAKQVGVSQMQVSRLLRQTLDFLHQHITDPKQSTHPQQATNATKRTVHPRTARPRVTTAADSDID